MPYGDSITEGDGGTLPYNSYRKSLAQQLTNAGFAFDLVGSRNSGDGTFDGDHQGIPGLRADQLADSANDYLTLANPDVVVVMAGTNDLSTGDLSSQVLTDIGHILDEIHLYDSAIKIVLCSLPPRQDDKATRTVEVNGLIADLVNERRGMDYLIWFADVHAAMVSNANWQADYMSDTVHPNDTGYGVVADAIFPVLQTALNSTTRGVVDDFNRAGPGLGTNWAADAAYAISNNELANSDPASFFPLATWIANANPSEVSMKWGAGADSAGINEGGLALMLDAPTATANGYFIWLSNTTSAGKRINLWRIQNGTPTSNLPDLPYTEPDPVAGDIFTVKMTSDANAHHFDCYINGVLYGRISDTSKLEGNTAPLYAGVMLRGGLNNNIDDFDFKRNSDQTAPAAINDLATQVQGGTTIAISWTAPGDDGVSGTASAYDIRYSTTPISEANFSSANKATSIPVPQAAGTAEAMTVTGLFPGTQYYFAIKTSDDAGNVSSISNVPFATTTQGATFTDSFDRQSIGANWVFDPAFAILDSNLCNTSIVNSWNFMAILQAKKNPIEATLTWANSADANGIDVAGFALLMDAPSTTANGYLLFRRPVQNTIDLWEIQGGGPATPIQSVAGAVNGLNPGDAVRVVIRKEAGGNFFDVFINGVFDGTVQDSQKRQGTGAETYAGVMVSGNQNNCIAAFSVTTEIGPASQISVFSGDGQSGQIGTALPAPLTALVTDDNGNPKPNETVKYTVINGSATLEAPPAYELRVDVGAGNPYTDQVGRTWEADKAFTAGSYGFDGGNVGQTNSPIANTNDDPIYQTERWGLNAYRVGNLPNGQYSVILHFCEFIYTSAGKRVFSVKIEGQTVLSNFDISQQAGGKNRAITRTFSVTLADNQLDVEFIKNVEMPEIVGIEVLGIGDPLPVTNGSGLVSQVLRLGNTIGQVQVQVTGASFAETQAATFTATVTPGAASQIVAISGNNQTGTGGQPLGQPFVVEVRDAAGNPKSGYAVKFMSVRGGGTFDKAQPVLSDASGRVSVTLTLGNQSSTNEVLAIADGLSGSPVSFTATANGGIGSALQLVSGNNQQGAAGAALPAPVVVQVVDTNGQPVPNFPAGFYIRRGGGTTSKNAPIINPDLEAGFYNNSLGDIAQEWGGWNDASEQIFSQVQGETGTTSAQRINTTGTAITASFYQTIVNTPPDGAGQRLFIKYRTSSNAPVALELIVRNVNNLSNRLFDINLPGTNNAWYSVDYDFTWDAQFEPAEILAVIPDNQIADIDAFNIGPLTDSNGQLSATWTMGDSANTQEIEAVAFKEGAPIAGSSVLFQANASAAAAQVITAVGGDGQVGIAGRPLANPFEVKVTDAFGNPKVGHPVLFDVTAGGGSLDGSGTSVQKNTGSDGIASVLLTLGSAQGANNIVQASSSENGTPLTNSPITFQAVAAVPTKLVRLTGNNQAGSATHLLDAPFKVLVLDNQDRPISGYDVTFNVTKGGGTINGQSSLMIKTGSNGEASAPLLMGPTPGAVNEVQVIATSQGTHLAGSPMTFTANAADLSALQIIGGNGQSGNVGAKLTDPLKIKVVDTRGLGISGWDVTFTVTGGGGKLDGDVATKTIKTDSLGIASTGFTLGSTPGVENNTVDATAVFNGNPLNGSPATFKATAVVGAPVALVLDSGDKQRGVVGLPLPLPLKAKVVDALNNGVPNHEVTFEVKAGGGAIAGQTLVKVQTDQNGIAQVTLTVGTVAGEDNNIVEVRALSGTTPLGGSPLLFTASATSSAARFLEYVSGGKQSGTAGSQLAQMLTVKVTDASAAKNPVQNHPVIFKVIAGGGTLSLNGSSGEQVVASTDGQGIAHVNWTLGGLVAPDSQFVEASSTDGQQALTGSPVQFSALAQPGGTSPTVSKVDATGPVPADGSSKSFVTVYLKDAFGNPVIGHAVSVRVSGSANNIEQPLTLTDTSGKVEATFTSTRAELKTVTAFDINAQAEVTNGDTTRFLPLAAQRLIGESGNNQIRNVGTALKEPLSAKVTDINGNAVSHWPVQFTVKGGDGYFLESQPIYTDAFGVAKATYILGPNPGQNSMEAVAQNLSTPPVAFTATGKVGTASQMQAIAGSSGQTGVAGEPLPNPVGVIITDGNGDPIAGHEVTFSISFGDGSVNGGPAATVMSDPFGRARVNWRLGTQTGPNILEAVSPGLGSAKEIFTAQGVGGLASNLVLVGQNVFSGTVGGQAPSGLAVRVEDKNGNPVENFIVHFQLIKGTGSLSATEATTNTSGIASVTFVFGSEAGERVVRAYGDGLANSPINFYLTANAAGPTTAAILDGNNQSGTIGKPLSRALRVLVKDNNNNPVPNVEVSFVPTQNNGNFPNGPKFTTDERGIAAANWVLGTNTGVNKAWAIVQGLPQIEFTATGFTNNFPVFAPIAPLEIDELDRVEFTVSATDDDGDLITYGIRNIPPGASYDSLVTRKFTWETGYNNAGVHEVVFTATDVQGGLSELLVTIKVNNVNRPPMVTNWQPAAETIIVEAGKTQHFEMTATDLDGDQVGYLWFLDGKHVGSTNTYTFQPGKTGSFMLKAKAFDYADTTSRTWRADVITAIQLTSFTASVQTGNGVKIEWITSQESNNAGFNILRSTQENGPYRPLNESLIQSAGVGRYVYVDKNIKAGWKYYYKLEDVSYAGEKELHGPLMVEIALPETFELSQNYPNPFNPSTNILYQLPEPATVKLVIFNVLGQEVRRLVDAKKPAGFYTVLWDGRNSQGIPLPSGVYYFKIQAGKFIASKKMLLLK